VREKRAGVGGISVSPYTSLWANEAGHPGRRKMFHSQSWNLLVGGGGSALGCMMLGCARLGTRFVISVLFVWQLL
jgi:hypothetical protein